MNSLLRPALASLFAILFLAGCADRTATKPVPVRSIAPPPTSSGDASPRVEPSKPDRHRGATRPLGNTEPSRASSSEPSLPESTGIPACDDYLASYRACHRAARIYAPDQIESRYKMMRQSLLRDSLNPDVRPQLSRRCNALASSLRNALHGKSCMP